MPTPDATRSPRCPRCGYDLSGQVATWRDACPLQCPCTECGATIHWSVVLRRRGVASFESARGIAVTPALTTCLHALHPWRFWRRVDPKLPVPRRLALWPLAVIVPLWLGAATLVFGSQMLDAWAETAYLARLVPGRPMPPIDWGIALRRSVDAAATTPSLLLDIPTVRGPVHARHGPRYRIGATSVSRPIRPPPSMMAAAVLSWLAWSAGMVGACVLSGAARSRSWAAVVRITIYSAAPVMMLTVAEAVLLVWAAVATMAQSIVFVSFDFRLPIGPPDWVVDLVFGGAAWPVVLLIAAWFGVSWWRGLIAAREASPAQRVLVGGALAALVASLTLLLTL